ncbi:MAG: HAMP domain-containing sensor histidine kinase [Actinomycetota bacterium]
MQRRLTIALALTAMVSIILVGLGVLIMARVSATSDAEDDVKRGLRIVGQFLDDQDRTTLRLNELLASSRQDFQLDSLGAALLTDDGEIRSAPGRGPGRTAALSGDELPDLADLTPDQRLQLAQGDTVLMASRGQVVGVRAVPLLRVGQQADVTVVIVGSRRISTVSRRTLVWFLGSSAVVLIGAVAAGTVLARRLAQPLRDMQTTTAAIAAGDLGARVHNVGTDEVADLGLAVNRMAEDLQRSKALDRQFLMSVSHDLKTPLTAIAGYAEALSDGATTDSRAAGDIIGNHADRLNRLVGDLLDLAKLDANRFQFDIRPFDLGVLAGRTVAGLSNQAASHGLTLSVTGLPSVMVNGDADRSAQAVGNLIDNAIKFANSAITVLVTTHSTPEGDWAVVAVQDDGPGIPEADLGHIFDRLYTGADQPKRAENPTGLGLAIVRELIGAMGGQVAAANNRTGGASLSFRLPLAGPVGPGTAGMQRFGSPGSPTTQPASQPPAH